MMSQLTPHLKSLRLSGILETLESRHKQARDEQWTHVEVLARLLEDEVARRAQKQLALRVRRANLTSTKTLEAFDFTFNPTVSRQQVRALAACDFVRHHGNVILCGPTGVGKSHLAQALAHEACLLGFTALFVQTHKMLQHLNGGRADGSYERRLQSYLRPDLLVLDDFGLRPLRPPGPEDLYEIIDARYETGSIVLTSNRAPAEWAEVFHDPLLASAGLDRLLHHAEVLVMTGDSYRAQHRQVSLDGKTEAVTVPT
ncbi:MAG: ATP-binding protein [Chloroflexi bacterium]|nr:ATP-binding protein [Chloroflexota bacterium]